jgi:hypothetical protein
VKARISFLRSTRPNLPRKVIRVFNDFYESEHCPEGKETGLINRDVEINGEFGNHVPWWNLIFIFLGGLKMKSETGSSRD